MGCRDPRMSAHRSRVDAALMQSWPFSTFFSSVRCAPISSAVSARTVLAPAALMQSIADMFKILIKELISLNHIDKFLFAWLHIWYHSLDARVLPCFRGAMDFRSSTQRRHLLPLAVFLRSGSARHSAGRMVVKQQVYPHRRPPFRRADVSYELSMGLCVVTMVVMAGTMSGRRHR